MSDKMRYIERIRKLFALSSDNPSEEEATAAALQAQRLMVKYSIDPSEIEDGVAARVPVSSSPSGSVTRALGGSSSLLS